MKAGMGKIKESQMFEVWVAGVQVGKMRASGMCGAKIYKVLEELRRLRRIEPAVGCVMVVGGVCIQISMTK